MDDIAIKWYENYLCYCCKNIRNRIYKLQSNLIELYIKKSTNFFSKCIINMNSFIVYNLIYLYIIYI
jgi:hypothetical protein